ncbi:hypothetical protein TRIUR3_29180 [Triticum urartu]|uniref:Uncharacterized protein n=1 Tax=Triticum urartu TaxID=4572 RepID=M7YY45_TRIUA|nr:hypothetical protein TRIUR3_29180 [Triticum urartu]
MESEQVKRRFGRCPYCRAMIYQDPQAVIYYCSKCRTPIRGKNPEPTDDTEYSLAQLEILSFDTMSTYSDETDPPNGGDLEPGSRDNGGASSSSAYRPYSAIRTGPRSGDLGRHDEADQVLAMMLAVNPIGPRRDEPPPLPGVPTSDPRLILVESDKIRLESLPSSPS